MSVSVNDVFEALEEYWGTEDALSDAMADGRTFRTWCPSCNSRPERTLTVVAASGRAGIWPMGCACSREGVLEALGLERVRPVRACQGLWEKGGQAALAAVVGAVRGYVSMSESQAVAVALWVLHTHSFEASEATPYLAVTSAEKQSGKTRLLDVLELLVARPWRAIQPSEAVLYRKIAADAPTLLLDEVDTLYGPKARGEHEGLRALLNAGHRRNSTVPRCVGEGTAMVVKDFPTYGPKALAGIGELPDTVADRSIPIRMKRRGPGEQVKRFHRREAEEALAPLRDLVAGWGEAHVDELADARPELPDALSDRASEGWEPLLAIADSIGGEWPERARAAAVALSSDGGPDEGTLGVRLLSDVRAVLDGRQRISTADLLAGLLAIEEAPWSDWWGKPLTPRTLSRLLKPYEVASRQVRFEDGRRQGYQREDFEDAWRRYLASPSPEALTDPDSPDNAREAA